MPIDLSTLPHSHGVYLMRDQQAKIIYIGKANDLKKRVASYFQKPQLHPKISILVSSIRHIDYLPTSSERESLLLEQKLIKKVQPLYNTMWRDDKSYPYVKITINEDYPRIFLTRKKENDGAKYFGPYPQVSVVKKLLRTLWRNRIFNLRPCKHEFHENNIKKGLQNSQPQLYKKVKSCIYLHTQKCTAPCFGNISKSSYRRIVKRVMLYFSGNTDAIQNDLTAEMKKASKKLDYEKAAQIRDHLNALQHISEKVTIRKIDEANIIEQTELSRGLSELQEKLHLPAPPIRIEAFDISNLQGKEAVGSIVVFDRGNPSKSEYRKFKIKTVQCPNDFLMMEEIVSRRYRRLSEENRKFPDLMIVDGGKGQISAAVQALASLRKSGYKLPQLHIAGLAKKNEEIFLPDMQEPVRLPSDSPALHIIQHIRDEAHRFAITFHRQRRNNSTLSMSKI